MKITERLNVEHGLLLELLDRLDALVARNASPALLAGATAMLAAAADAHCALEDTLHDTLRRSLGIEFPPLVAAAAAHREIARLSKGGDDAIPGGDAAALSRAVRDHVEREIHLILPLAQEWLPERMLERMSDWEGEHVREHVERRRASPTAV